MPMALKLVDDLALTRKMMLTDSDMALGLSKVGYERRSIDASVVSVSDNSGWRCLHWSQRLREGEQARRQFWWQVVERSKFLPDLLSCEEPCRLPALYVII
jgi:hypothetical protein